MLTPLSVCSRSLLAPPRTGGHRGNEADVGDAQAASIRVQLRSHPRTDGHSPSPLSQRWRAGGAGQAEEAVQYIDPGVTRLEVACSVSCTEVQLHTRLVQLVQQ